MTSSKICHVKLFGTRDLRHGNLPHRDDMIHSHSTGDSVGRAASPPPSPTRLVSTTGLTQPQPLRAHQTGGASVSGGSSKSPPPLLRPNRTVSPAKGMSSLQALDDLVEEFEAAEVASHMEGQDGGTTNAAGLILQNRDVRGNETNGAGGARAVVLPLNGYPRTTSPRTIPVPLASTMTGTRYGAALGGPAATPLVPAMTGRQWGAGTPKCPRCGKSVFFAEQVKAVGKTWHKACLRCMECGKTLDSGQLVDKDNEPFCRRCYGKKFGPQGSGYALLGKPGG
ncbi:hypothetical protein GSI_11682 [Ganoderma sinense ZZ0214-1]|uniref:LIM zinc-binding domain-containing protein n=1 Tax=Ganoderma sinense ZZ0214-1 TaxID=1077348 RepID=A0A2G8RWN3_9APHY|nr:hypothetical protein GSI_11682 [Ganoderma sinense ZZ0214-1]